MYIHSDPFMDIGSTVQTAVWRKAVSSIFKITVKQRPGTLVLDPLSVVLVLAINAFKPVGTKLYFGNGILELHDPGILQGTVRAWSGESKGNIRLLNNPIIYACKHFFQSNDVFSDKYSMEDIQYLFNNAVRGLENLRHTYRDDRDAIAYLNSYINIIVASKEMKSGTSEVLDLLLKLKLSDVAVDIVHDYENEQSSHQQHTMTSATTLKANLFVELQNAWSPNKIATMIGLLKELEYATPFGQKHMFVALDAFLICIHEKTKLTIETLFDIK